MQRIKSRSTRASSVIAAVAVVTGCTSWGPIVTGLTEADFMTIKPGMTQEQVIARFGRPTWAFGVWQEHLTVLNYRYNHNDCLIYQVSVRPDGIVRDANSAWDPACDGPSGKD